MIYFSIQIIDAVSSTSALSSVSSDLVSVSLFIPRNCHRLWLIVYIAPLVFFCAKIEELCEDDKIQEKRAYAPSQPARVHSHVFPIPGMIPTAIFCHGKICQDRNDIRKIAPACIISSRP